MTAHQIIRAEVAPRFIYGGKALAYQSASTATSSKSPTLGSGIEWMSSNPIAREESEPRRVYETYVVSWN